MNLICVSSGSYNAFYCNNFSHIKKCDLLIFNFGIFNQIKDLNDSEYSFVAEEIAYLSNKLNGTVVAGVVINNIQHIVCCCDNRITVKNAKNGITLNIKKKSYCISSKYGGVSVNNKIVLSQSKMNVNLTHCSKRKNYIFVHSHGALFIKNKKLQRKFNKCSKFILK